MSRHRHAIRNPAPGAHVTASVAVRDGEPASDDNCSGIAVKQVQPGQDTPRADLDLIAATEKYYVWFDGEADFVIPDALSVAKGDELWIDPVTNALSLGSAAAQAKRIVGVVANNNAIRFTAREPGDEGNDIRVQLRDPAGNDQALAVDTDGDDIIVSLATGVAGAITSTAAQVIAAVNEHDTASQLVVAANEGASSGAGVVTAAALAALTGGGEPNAALRRFGKVVYVGPERGLPNGSMTVNFNLRADF